MLTVLTERQEIETAQLRWRQRTVSANPKLVNAQLGWQGGDKLAALYWFESYGFWIAHEMEPNRWWNPCGLDDPVRKTSPDIVVEINPPYDGLEPGITGAFARDEKGRRFVIHRGWLGGGYHPVSKEVFFRQFDGQIGYVGTRKTDRVALVGELDSPSFLEDLSRFVRECRRLKQST